MFWLRFSIKGERLVTNFGFFAIFGGINESSKNQHSSRYHRALDAIWRLEFDYSLVLGCWCLVLILKQTSISVFLIRSKPIQSSREKARMRASSTPIKLVERSCGMNSAASWSLVKKLILLLQIWGLFFQFRTSCQLFLHNGFILARCFG